MFFKLVANSREHHKLSGTIVPNPPIYIILVYNPHLSQLPILCDD